MARPGTLSDVPAIVEIVRAFHAEGRYQHMTFSAERVTQIVSMCIESGFALIVESEGIEGLMLGIIGPHTLSMDLVATELLLFVSKDKRGGFTAMRLIREFTDWAKDRGAVECFAGSTAQIATDLTQRLYEKNGFAVVGPLLARRL